MKRSIKRSLSFNGAVDVWGRGLLGRLQATLGRQKANRMKLMAGGGSSDHQFWEETQQQSSAFAILGRRPRMEDRFIIEENINNNTGISFFAVFDGHGGEFAADFAKDILVKNLYHKIIETAAILKGHSAAGGDSGDHLGVDGNTSDYDNSPYLKRKSSRKDESNKENNASAAAVRRRDSLRKAHSSTDDCTTPKQTTPHREQDVFTSKLNSLIRPLGKDNLFNISNNSKEGSKQAPPSFDAKCYIENGKINFGKMITDEVLAADYKLVEAAKKTTNIAGTTALIAIIQGTRLIVANVGDSRGVMCDSRGVAIPLSFDHKPQQVRERKRIHDAGGFIAFRGVWRVAGILATSRALGDYPLKDKNLVIANPDILTFELNDHKPTFLILASDGLWDTFSNEEAVAFIKEHIHEADYGAKSLAMQSYYRGSVDNITVVIIVFRNGVYRITAHAAQPVASTSHSSPASPPAASRGTNGNSPLSATSSNKNAPSSK